MKDLRCFCLKAVLFWVVASISVVAQQDISTGSPLIPSSGPQPILSLNQTTLLQFQLGQQALGQSLKALLALNPTTQQVQAWAQQNASALATQQQQATFLADASAMQPAPYIADVDIPEGASSTLSDFLVTRADLMNARAQIHNQLLSSLPAGATDAQIHQVQQSEGQLFQQQNLANIQAQEQRAQTLADEAAQQVQPLPPPLVVPPGTSPQLAAFLTAQNQLMRDQIAFSNQYVTATPAVRAAAMQSWMQQNAARFQQVQQLIPASSAITPQ